MRKSQKKKTTMMKKMKMKVSNQKVQQLKTN